MSLGFVYFSPNHLALQDVWSPSLYYIFVLMSHFTT